MRHQMAVHAGLEPALPA